MSWPRVTLGQVAEINPCLPKSADEKQQVSFLGMASVSMQGEITSEETRVLAETKKGFTYFERGDVLLAKITPCFENGKAVYTNSLKNPIGYGSTEFHVLRSKSDVLDAKYMFYMVWSDQFRFLGGKAMKGAAGQKRISADFLKEFNIPLPPLTEQKRIAAILDKADSLRRKNQQAIQLADKFLRAVFLDMFGDPVGNPKGWDVKPLGDVAPSKPIRSMKVGDDEDVWLLNLDQVESNTGKILNKYVCKFSEVGNSTSWFDNNHILYSKLRPYLNKVVLPNELGVATTELLPLKPDPDFLVREYLVSYLQSDSFVSWANGKVAGAKMPRLSTSELWKHPLLIPPVELQIKFAEIYHRVTQMRLSQQSALAKSHDYFNSLSQKAFTAKL